MATKLRVLIIDDSADDAELTLRELRRSGYEPVWQRVDTEEALEAALDGGTWEVILSDYTMPKFGGLEAHAVVRRRGLDVPFIFVSETMGEDVAVAAMRTGAHDYLTKGNLRRLVPAIERELREAGVRHDRSKAQAERRAAEARFRQILALAPDAIVAADDSCRITVFNRAAEQLFGYPAEEAIGHSLDLLWPDRVAADQRRLIMEFARAPGAAAPVNERNGVFGRRKNGEEFPVEASLSKLDDAEQTTLTIILRDISERQRTEQELQLLARALQAANEGLEQRVAERTSDLAAANQKLTTEMAERQRVEAVLRQAQKLEAIGRLAGGVAHNFNNLLMVVLGNLDMAQRAGISGEKSRHMLAAAGRAAERGARVTRQLLAFAGRQSLNAVVIEPSERLRDFAGLLGQSLGGNLSIETDIPDDLWAVEIDPSELELALLNLGLNARDAMPDGGLLRIVAQNRTLSDRRLDLEGDYLAIEMSDSGTGIAPENLPRIFEPFFTTKDFASGSGLGLSQVHGFASQSLGAVDVDSELGKGTTVRLYLPAWGKRQATRPQADPAEADPAAAPEARPATILVVEDDVDVAELAVALLQQSGFKVKLADRARAALDMLRGGDLVDLIFSDILMPDGMSGIELAEVIMRLFPRIPVLLASGYAEAADEAKARGLQIVAKPYRAAELCARIGGLLVERPI